MLFKHKPAKRIATKLQTATIRNFTGGWNSLDDDTNLSTKFAVVLQNMHRGTNNEHILRFGSRWYTDVKYVVSGDIVNHTYFNGRLISVTDEGEITSTDGGGITNAIFNASIAAGLPGSPAGWTNPTDRANFVPFKTSLIIHNGVDKPLVVSSLFGTSYLSDPSTGSNANVPIGKFGTVVGNYHVIGGIPGEPTLIYISSVGTSGVFPGDPAPNDSISFDVGAYSPSQSDEIRGLHTYRNQLIVFFTNSALLITLGNYNSSGTHEPQVADEIPAFGLLGQRGAVSVINDMIFMDVGGVNSARRNLFAGLVETDRISDLIAPSYQSDWTNHTSDEQQDKTFAVYNRLANQVMLCDVIHGKVYVWTFDSKFRKRSWSEYVGWTWTSACSSAFGRVFFSEGTKIFQYGNNAFSGENFHADKLNDRDSTWDVSIAYSIGDLIWDDLTEESYTCAVAHTSPASGTFEAYRDAFPDHWTIYEGEEISFNWELPWSDAQQPMKLKGLRYISFGGKGEAAFTVEAYVDDLYKAGDGSVVYDPALSLEFIGSEGGGFGLPPVPAPMGGGRKMDYPLLWSYPVKFKTIKLRIQGSTRKALSISTIHLLFAIGMYKRVGGL